MLLWVAAISALHGTLNLGWFHTHGAVQVGNKEKFKVGFIPVTCHLTCPVTDFINKELVGEGQY